MKNRREKKNPWFFLFLLCGQAKESQGSCSLFPNIAILHYQFPFFVFSSLSPSSSLKLVCVCVFLWWCQRQTTHTHATYKRKSCRKNRHTTWLKPQSDHPFLWRRTLQQSGWKVSWDFALQKEQKIFFKQKKETSWSAFWLVSMHIIYVPIR